MESKYVEYQKSLKKEQRFGTPKYEMEFSTNLSKKCFIYLAKTTIEKLGWQIIYLKDNFIEARIQNKLFGFTHSKEFFTAFLENGNIRIKSVTEGSEFWDNGRNSKNAKLFVYAFLEEEKNVDKNKLSILASNFENEINWDDYEILEALPKPKLVRKPKFWINSFGGLSLSFCLALIFATLKYFGIYFIGVSEITLGIIIALAFKYLTRLSNYTNYQKLKHLLVVVVVLVYLLSRYFHYELEIIFSDLHRIGFLDFLKNAPTKGISIKGLNLGLVGFAIGLALQFLVTYSLASIAFLSFLLRFQVDRVPSEVVDYAMYHLIKGKSEDYVREELKLKGWSEKQSQDEVIEALNAFELSVEMNRVI